MGIFGRKIVIFGYKLNISYFVNQAIFEKIPPLLTPNDPSILVEISYENQLNKEALFSYIPKVKKYR